MLEYASLAPPRREKLLDELICSPSGKVKDAPNDVPDVAPLARVALSVKAARSPTRTE